jgi:MFS family permease
MTVATSQTQTSLTREQKEAVGLLSIGTMLEYFDLMLYVHMAVLLNELFFPKTDPFTASLLSALAFCSSYILRPFAALIFGYIGDNIGRKATVVITTFLMSFSCIVMANLPTYSQIGITAAWIVTFCRIIQGMSSMGEVVGAELYLTEMIKPPSRYFAVSSMTVAATVGVTVALGVAFFVTSFGINWRIAFWFGAAIALIGSIARTSLRETTEFIL